MKNTFVARAALLSAFLLTGAAAQAQNYSFQTLSVSNNVITEALDVSDTGLVVGWDTNFSALRAFTENNGTYTIVNVPGYTQAQLTASSGTLLYGIGAGSQGFSLDAQGNLTKLFVAPHIAAVPAGVNGGGVVVGSYKSQTVHTGAFLLQNGAYTTYSAPGSYDTSFSAINDHGVVVGTWNTQGGIVQSFQYANGQIKPILVPGSYATTVTGINNAGVIVGWYEKTSQGPIGMFKYDGTTYGELPMPPNAIGCRPAHINNLGSFVGSCFDPATQFTYAFLATPQGARD